MAASQLQLQYSKFVTSSTTRPFIIFFGFPGKLGLYWKRIKGAPYGAVVPVMFRVLIPMARLLALLPRPAKLRTCRHVHAGCRHRSPRRLRCREPSVSFHAVRSRIIITDRVSRLRGKSGLLGYQERGKGKGLVMQGSAFRGGAFKFWKFHAGPWKDPTLPFPPAVVAVREHTWERQTVRAAQVPGEYVMVFEVYICAMCSRGARTRRSVQTASDFTTRSDGIRVSDAWLSAPSDGRNAASSCPVVLVGLLLHPRHCSTMSVCRRRRPVKKDPKDLRTDKVS